MKYTDIKREISPCTDKVISRLKNSDSGLSAVKLDDVIQLKRVITGPVSTRYADATEADADCYFRSGQALMKDGHSDARNVSFTLCYWFADGKMPKDYAPCITFHYSSATFIESNEQVPPIHRAALDNLWGRLHVSDNKIVAGFYTEENIGVGSNIFFVQFKDFYARIGGTPQAK